MVRGSRSKIKGECPDCQTQFEFNLSDDDFSNKIQMNDPAEVRFLKRIGGDDKIALKVLNHNTHLLVLEINYELQILTKLVVDKIKAGMDTLVNENVNACRTIDNMLETDSMNYKPRVLFLSHLDYFLKFVQSQLSLMILCGDDFDFEKRKHSLSIYFDNFIYTVGRLEYCTNFCTSTKRDGNLVKLKSLVIDTSVYDNEIILKYFSISKINLSGVKVIIAYNSNLTDDLGSQFDLRDRLYRDYKAEIVSLGDIANVESRRYVNIEAIISITMDENLAKSYIQNQVTNGSSGIV